MFLLTVPLNWGATFQAPESHMQLAATVPDNAARDNENILKVLSMVGLLFHKYYSSGPALTIQGTGL